MSSEQPKSGMAGRLAGAFIGFCFAMLPIAHRIWD